jgi:hypothetical protein
MTRQNRPTQADAENVRFHALQEAVIIIGLDRGLLTLTYAGVDRKTKAAARELAEALLPVVDQLVPPELARRCRVCGCTQDDCSQCIKKTGQPCSWVAWDLCSACETPAQAKRRKSRMKRISEKAAHS